MAVDPKGCSAGLDHSKACLTSDGSLKLRSVAVLLQFSPITVHGYLANAIFPHMPIIFHWIFSGCLKRSLSTLTALLAVYIIIETFDKTRFLGEDFTLPLLIEYLALKSPFMIAEFMPIVILVSTSLYLIDLSRHNEIIAIRAAGLGINKLVTPILSVSVLAGLLTFAIGQWVTPITNHQLQRIEKVHIKHLERPDQAVQWLKDGHRFVKITPLARNQYAVVILESDGRGHWLRKIESQKAIYNQEEWILHDVFISTPDQTGLKVQQQDVMTLPSKAAPQATRPPEPDEMNLMQLRHYISSLEHAGLKVAAYAYAFHKKLAAPLACLFMALLAVALCVHVSNRTRAASWGLVTSISVGLLYYVAGNASGLLAVGDQLPPAFAAWLPNLVFGGLSVFLILHREGI